MGFLGEIRKLLFGVKSVSKSGAEKVADKSMEIGEDILEKGSEVLGKGKEFAGDVVGKGTEKLGDLGESVGNKLSDLKDKAKGILDNVSESDTAKKAGEFTENVGEKVMEVGGKAAEKAADLSEKVGSKVLDAKDKLMEKANELGDKLSDKYDETYEKAKELEAQEALEPKGEFADTPLDAGGSLLEDTDDFFSKAERYAEGDYSDKGKVTIGDAEITLPEGNSAKEMGKVAGMTDIDGDGNELVDDAIIIEDDAEILALDAPDAISEKVTDIKDSATEKVSEMVDKTEQKITDIVDGTKDAAKGIASEANDKLSEVSSQKLSEMEDMMDAMGEEE